MNMDDAFDAQNMAEADAEMDIALNQYDYGEHWFKKRFQNMMNITKLSNKKIMQVLSENEFYYEILRFCT